MSKPIILCVDDEKIVLDTLVSQLTGYMGDDYDFETAQSGSEGIEVFEEMMRDGLEIPVVISDQLMPGLKGDEMLIALHKIKPECHKVLLTGQASADAVGRAVNFAKLYRYIAKPWDRMDLLLTIEEAAKSYMQNIQILEQNRMLALLFEAAKILSKETQLENLIAKLVQVVILNTRADRGCFILVENDLLRPAFCMTATFPHGPHTLPEIQLDPEGCHVSATILAQVMSSRRRLVIQNVKTAGIDDQYLRERSPKSVLCYPLIHDRNMLGLFYLESFQSTGVFNNDSVEFMKLLSVKAAISIENAKLYTSLEEKVEVRTREVMEQKQIIEEKNKDITDSIKYARRIQGAMLPPVQALTAVFPDSFIFYKPKDIVSGDFYWFLQKADHIIFAIADCTGHGVPGAMLSVLGGNLLNSIVAEEGITQPDLVLQRLHNRMVEKLRADIGTYDSQDGMDIAICTWNMVTKQMTFAGAQRPLWLIRPGQTEALEYKGDRLPIGGSIQQRSQNPYTLHVAEVQPGDALYVFSDGITDQFGAGTGSSRKYGTKRLYQLLADNYETPMPQVNVLLQQELAVHQGHLEQTDDICLIGIRLPK